MHPSRRFLECMAKKKPSLGCLFWLALVLLAVVVFLFSRDTIRSVIDKTGFLTALKPQRQEDTTVIVEPIPADSQSPSDQNGEGVLTVAPTSSGGDRSESEDSPAQPEPRPPAAESEQTTEAEPNVRRGRLYFVTVGEEGDITLTGLIRSIEYDDAPLAATLDLLFDGPSASETAQGYITLIPQGSRVEQLSVKGRTAYISFAESFRFNPFGYEGLRAQLQQVVYTATEFHNIDDVQVLISGRRTDFLGPEGMNIATPLSKQSFQKGHL